MNLRAEAYLVLSNIKSTCKEQINKYKGFGEPCRKCPYYSKDKYNRLNVYTGIEHEEDKGCIAGIFFEEEIIPKDWKLDVEKV